MFSAGVYALGLIEVRSFKAFNKLRANEFYIVGFRESCCAEKHSFWISHGIMRFWIEVHEIFFWHI
jgi:hypothetical protein